MIVQGPASVRVLSGEATILGAPPQFDRKLIVRQEKQLPIEASSEVDMEILTGESGKISEVEGSTIPKSWRSTADSLAEMKEGNVTVVGATDVGKSTLCTYLTNELLKRRLRLRLIDADIGQADIGPPTTISIAVPTSFQSTLADLTPEAMIFIGHTTPSKVETKIIDGIRRLVSRKDETLAIINTDGWVLDPEAIMYKLDLISAVKPDLVIGISAGTELDQIFSVSAARSMRVETSNVALTRSRSDRRDIRIASYRRFLDGGAVRALSLRNVQVRMPKGLPPIQRWQSRDLQNLIVGLLDNEGYLLQIGVLLGFDGEFIRVYSRPFARVREIELGFVRLSTEGIELGYLEI